MGGGGYGDPLAREPFDVAEDVARGVVGVQAARELFGVVLTDGGVVDPDGTAAERRSIRSARLGREAPETAGTRADVPRTERRIAEYLQRTEAGTQCTWCGGLVAGDGAHWQDGAIMREQPPEAGGRFRESVEGLLLRQWACPDCGTLLDTEVALEGDPATRDDIRRWPAGAVAAAGIG
jgi:N-methylhydantoinase B